MPQYVIPNLRRACEALMVVAQSGERMRIADLARRMKMPATTALRIVRTLEMEGFLVDDRGELRLGPSLAFLGSTAMRETDIRREAVPVLETLARETNETAHVAVPCDRRSLILAVCDSPHPLRAASRPGTLTDLYCSSTGKVFLAFIFAKQVADIFAEYPPKKRTPNTILELPAMQRELEVIRRRGYAVDNEEIHSGVRCLAAPVTGPAGAIVAAIGITAAAARFTPDRDSSLSAFVVKAAEELSRRLGHV
jgi:IclR family acetate operon transcriptional repressor